LSSSCMTAKTEEIKTCPRAASARQLVSLHPATTPYPKMASRPKNPPRQYAVLHNRQTKWSKNVKKKLWFVWMMFVT
jgi:hypothetical protein